MFWGNKSKHLSKSQTGKPAVVLNDIKYESKAISNIGKSTQLNSLGTKFFLSEIYLTEGILGNG